MTRTALRGASLVACIAICDVCSADDLARAAALKTIGTHASECRATATYRAKLLDCMRPAGGTPRDSRYCAFQIRSNEAPGKSEQTIRAGIAAYEPDPDANALLEQVVGGLAMPALSGTLENFLPGVQPELLQSLNNLADPQTLGVSANGTLAWLRFRVSGFAAPEPELSPALRQVLEARGQVESFGTQERSLDVGDDYYVTGEVTVLGPWFGRDFSAHSVAQTRLARTLWAGVDVAVTDDLPIQSLIDAEKALLIDSAADVSQADLVRQLNALACSAERTVHMLNEAQARQANAHISQFWRLVHNQPQLTISGRWLHRNEIVGADSRSVRVRLSTGLFNNVTWMKLTRRCDRHLGGNACPKQFEQMIDHPLFGWGLGATGYYEWGTLADVTLDLPSLPIGTTIPALPLPVTITPGPAGTDRYELTGGDYSTYGWSVGATLKAPELNEEKNKRTSVRIDGGYDYYRYRNHPVRTDHSAARITLTIRRGQFSFPLHIMYRAETEFEARVNDKVAFGIGSSYGW